MNDLSDLFELVYIIITFEGFKCELCAAFNQTIFSKWIPMKYFLLRESKAIIQQKMVHFTMIVILCLDSAETLRLT